MKRAVAFAAALVLVAFCRTATVTDPAAAFAAMESRLIAADSHVVFDAATKGSFESWGRGTLFLTAVDVRMEGEGMAGGTKKAIDYYGTDEKRPPEVKRAVVIGWTRMGLMHNVVRLVGGQSIEHAAGGMEEWVRVTDLQYDPNRRLFTFGIHVEGQDVGTAQLWLDRRGRPSRRTQEVRFPNGVMNVEERYSWR